LEHGGADIVKVTDTGQTVWTILADRLFYARVAPEIADQKFAEVTALLRVLVLRDAPPADFVAQLRPEHARVAEEDARLKAALPAYLVRQRTLLDTHCPLIALLLALVCGYDPEPTTTEELWATTTEELCAWLPDSSPTTFVRDTHAPPHTSS
jgi:hypothetical protein